MNGRLPAFRRSFFVSPKRKDGLQLQMFYQDGMVYCDLFVDNRFEGYAEVLHGGMIFGVLDVIIWYVIFMRIKKIAMTRKVDMEFLRPVMCNSSYRAKGELTKIEDKNIFATAWVEDASGEVYARVNAIFREGKSSDAAAFIDRLDFSETAPAIKDYFLSLLDTK
ncbi:MAG: putative Thioesterase superfamily protein [Deltaproteobacteria bacterium]|nr:putative Thioesterase superfamily protein [Deltaproteobacteria bacterium]